MKSYEMTTIRILIADDHAMLREGFRNMLRRHTEIEFAGEAENGRELLRLTAELKPDIVFIDVHMPVMDGIEAARLIHKNYPDTRMIALTSFDEENLIVDMLEAGATGYLLKNAEREEILQAIYAVYENNTYYCRQTSTKLAKMIASSKFNPYKKDRTTFSEREKEVIRFICQEFSNKEIAAALNLSIRTIEGYREKIQEKMNVHSTAGLVVYAIQKGFFKPGQ
ncbi:MAG: two component transcriptional regulator, LuxR family [Chitinophagaceae bacterium]|nr:two component transcriptional regulator, LuxR family [Chitinophagaceae bacterium]